MKKPEKQEEKSLNQIANEMGTYLKGGHGTIENGVTYDFSNDISIHVDLKTHLIDQIIVGKHPTCTTEQMEKLCVIKFLKTKVII